MENHIIHNLIDYVTGVETGLDSNGRKNRGGHLMEGLVESYLVKAGLVKGDTYFKEMYIHEIEDKWNVDLSSISNNGQAEKRFDFVVKGEDKIYGIETNFYFLILSLYGLLTVKDGTRPSVISKKHLMCWRIYTTSKTLKVE